MLPLSLFFAVFITRTIENCPSAMLGQVADVVSGVTKGCRFTGMATRSVPYLRVANVQDGYLDLSEIKTIEALPAEIAALTLRRGDVVMTEGGDFDKLGRGAIWDHDLNDCIHQNHVFRVRVSPEHLHPDYFATYLRTTEAKRYFLRCAKRTTNLASINITQLKALPVRLPPLDTQQRFSELLGQVRKMSRSEDDLIREADNLFDSLAHRAFRGEL